MKIAIAGYGLEGEANYRYWSADPSHEITIVDERDQLDRPVPEGTPTKLGVNSFQNLQGFDLVVRTAGLAPHKITTDGKIWSATNEFFAQCPAPIIGVTGSKGKGTTSSFIASILEAAGKKVWLVGNIGVASLDVLGQISQDDIVVYELSSFQLWDLQRSPKVAVVLMIEQDHLDVHKDMDEYVEAKAQIARHQGESDVLIFNAANQYAQKIAEASNAQHKIAYPSSYTTHIQDNAFYNGEQYICGVEAVQLPGVHNLDNAIAAIDAVWSFTQDTEAIKTGLQNFKGLPHRLAFVKTVNDVSYYDDSIATTPTSAIAGLRAFTGKPQVLILGGSSKGSDFSELAQEVTRHDVAAILIGDEATKIAAAFDAAGFTNFEIIENATAELFTKRAAELAKPGGVVLLSPAAASFGLFKNYADRGDQFVAAVNQL